MVRSHYSRLLMLCQYILQSARKVKIFIRVVKSFILSVTTYEINYDLCLNEGGILITINLLMIDD